MSSGEQHGPKTVKILMPKTADPWKTCTLGEILEVNLEIHEIRVEEGMKFKCLRLTRIVLSVHPNRRHIVFLDPTSTN